jgi:hypothetical protein
MFGLDGDRQTPAMHERSPMHEASAAVQSPFSRTTRAHIPQPPPLARLHDCD